MSDNHGVCDWQDEERRVRKLAECESLTLVNQKVVSAISAYSAVSSLGYDYHSPRRQPLCQRLLLSLPRVDAVVDPLDRLLQRAAGGGKRVSLEKTGDVVARVCRAEIRETAH